MITLKNLLKTLQNIPSRSIKLSPAQNKILNHQKGPAWVIAGPGSGKTEILTLLALRLLYVEGIDPRSLILTTFTEKAARNLEDRISKYQTHLIASHPSLKDIDVTQLRVGTMHGLCNDILQEFRDPEYQNRRLMDEFEQVLLIAEHMSILTAPDVSRDHSFWTAFEYMFQRGDTNLYDWLSSWRSRGKPVLPDSIPGATVLAKLFNRLIEDRVEKSKFAAQSIENNRLIDLYEEYLTILNDQHRSDFAHLQLRFLEFLGSELGRAFLHGNKDIDSPGIKWVLVDEYQDTNLIQEEIYLNLANSEQKNIIAVGDDDQAMYRFRGGSVECMVTFDQACKTFLGTSPSSKACYTMTENFRSHPDIVTFCNDFIDSFPVTKQSGSRVAWKPSLTPKSSISGSWPAVGILPARAVKDLPTRFAEAVRDLKNSGVINDYSECCLLLKSSKDSPMNAGRFMDALRDKDIPYYNPRNKKFAEQEEVRCMLGALMNIVDPDATRTPTFPRDLADLIANCRVTFQSFRSSQPDLDDYMQRCRNAFEKKKGKKVDANLLEIVYYILGFEPFITWQNDPDRRSRLGQVTTLLEAYCSTPYEKYPSMSRGSLKLSEHTPGAVINSWLDKFYRLFIRYLSQKGIDDIEDETVIYPQGRVPIMTMHQAKGLQFPIVFVGHMGEKANPTATQKVEDAMSGFPINPARKFTRPSLKDRALLDLVRQYFVAYSRAQYALILLASNSYLNEYRIPCGGYAGWLRSTIRPL